MVNGRMNFSILILRQEKEFSLIGNGSCTYRFVEHFWDDYSKKEIIQRLELSLFYFSFARNLLLLMRMKKQPSNHKICGLRAGLSLYY